MSIFTDILIPIFILGIASIGTWLRFSNNSSKIERIIYIFVIDILLLLMFFKAGFK